MSDLSSSGQMGLAFLRVQPTRRFRSTLTPEAVHAVLYGVLGGLISGVVGQFLLGRMFSNPLAQPFKQNDLLRLVALACGLALIGLTVTIILMGLMWKAPSHRSQFMTGAATGALFALVIHVVFLSGVVMLVSNRAIFATLVQNAGGQTIGDHALFSQTAYLSIVEGSLFVPVILAIGGLSGAFLGRLLIPIDSAPKGPETRDALGAFVILILPITFYAIGVMNVIFYALLDGSFKQDWQGAGRTYDQLIPVIVFPFVIPLIGQIISQLFAIFWVWRTEAHSLHRGMLRGVQVLYGLGASLGQVLLTLVINPTYLTSPLGISVTGLSVILAGTFIVLAQRKLSEQRQTQTRGLLEISTWDVWMAGLTALFIAWMFVGSLSVRLTGNLFTINSALIVRLSEGTIAFPNWIEAMFQWPVTSFFIGLGLAVGVTFIPLMIISWLANRAERGLFRR